MVHSKRRLVITIPDDQQEMKRKCDDIVQWRTIYILPPLLLSTELPIYRTSQKIPIKCQSIYRTTNLPNHKSEYHVDQPANLLNYQPS
jgi:hypothetical protein